MTQPQASDRNLAMYVCCRISTLPEPHVHSIRRRCSRCSEPVWVDSKNDVIASHQRIVCEDCLPELVKAGS